MVRLILKSIKWLVLLPFRLVWSGLKFFARMLRKAWSFLVNTAKKTVENVRKTNERIDTVSDKLFGGISLRPTPRSSFWKAFFEELTKLLTMSYWIKLFSKTILWATVFIVIPVAIYGMVISVSLPAIRLPAIPQLGLVSPLFTPEVRRWTFHIMWWSYKYNVDPNAAATIMQIESCGDPAAVSTSDAQGLFQVMPFHFDSEEHMLNPGTNAKRGLTYFAEMLELADGDYSKAFAAYNGGPGAMYPERRVNETQRYVYWAEGIYADAVSGETESARLTEWLEAGGVSLCAQASNHPVRPLLDVPETIRIVQEASADNPTTSAASSDLVEAIFGNLGYVADQIAPAVETIQLEFDPDYFPLRITNDVCDERGLPLSTAISGYTYHDPTNPTHNGIDQGVYVGMPIPTTIAGKVVYAGWNDEGYGNLVIVSNGTVQTYYAHLSKVSVTVNQEVRKGQIIGEGGSTGNSSGPHLHYEVRVNYVPINPMGPEAYLLTCGSK